MLERSVEAGLIKKVKQHGGICLKFTSPGTRGVPDRLIIYRGRVIFVELKQEKGRITALQKRMHERLRYHGAEVYVAYGSEGVRKLIEELWPDEVQTT